MDRGAWRATVHGFTELHTTEGLTLTSGYLEGQGVCAFLF